MKGSVTLKTRLCDSIFIESLRCGLLGVMWTTTVSPAFLSVQCPMLPRKTQDKPTSCKDASDIEARGSNGILSTL